MIAILVACGGPSSPPEGIERYVAALETVKTDAEAGLAMCLALQGDQRTDCTWAAVKRLKNEDAVERACTALGDADDDECWFVGAENTRAPAFCHRAGAYVGDCLMHLFSWGLEDWLPAGTTPAEAVAIVRPQLRAWEMPPTSQSWYETFAYVLTSPVPPATGCEEVDGKPRRECEAAANAIDGDPGRAPPAVHRARASWRRQARKRSEP